MFVKPCVENIMTSIVASSNRSYAYPAGPKIKIVLYDPADTRSSCSCSWSWGPRGIDILDGMWMLNVGPAKDHYRAYQIISNLHSRDKAYSNRNREYSYVAVLSTTLPISDFHYLTISQRDHQSIFPKIKEAHLSQQIPFLIVVEVNLEKKRK